jgi:hypothetical protein
MAGDKYVLSEDDEKDDDEDLENIDVLLSP